MSDTPPQRPPKPKHIPFWPVLAAIGFMLAVVIAGLVSSNHARGEKLTIVTSTLPPRNGKATTTSTSAKPSVNTLPNTTVSSGPSAACTDTNLVNAAIASDKAGLKAMAPNLKARIYECAAGYAVAYLTPSTLDKEQIQADFKLENGAWVLINAGQVDLVADGVPPDVANQLSEH